MRKVIFFIMLAGMVLVANQNAFASEYRQHRGRYVKDRSFHHSHRKDGDYIKYGYLIIRDILHNDCDHHHDGRHYGHYKRHNGTKVCKVVYRGHGHHSRYKQYCYRR